MRIDKYMVERGLSASRAKAQEMLKNGAVSVDGVCVKKPSYEVEQGSTVTVEENPLQRYVGRGGLKLEAALDAFSLSPQGRVALDVGASSGGFTDCLLQRGAAYVYAVDAGSGQLHPDLLADSRVRSLENCNARYLSPDMFSRTPSFAVMDVSFISQTLILPAIKDVMTEGGVLVSLIKPQFELGRAALGKGGIVKNEKLSRQALAKVESFAETLGFTTLGDMPSPIRGGDGNLEFLAVFSLPSK